MTEEIGLIDIPDDDWSKVIADPSEYKLMVIDVLKEDSSQICQDIRQKLVENQIDDELDMKLRELSTIVPYNILIPLLREQLGLSIQTDKDCITSLQDIRDCLEDPEDKKTIDHIIGFINGEDLDESVIPETDLLEMINQLPTDKFPALFNCIDYVAEVSYFAE